VCPPNFFGRIKGKQGISSSNKFLLAYFSYFEKIKESYVYYEITLLSVSPLSLTFSFPMRPVAYQGCLFYHLSLACLCIIYSSSMRSLLHEREVGDHFFP
jgi:hypothetical protein